VGEGCSDAARLIHVRIWSDLDCRMGADVHIRIITSGVN
jgi:hypothetical protein